MDFLPEQSYSLIEILIEFGRFEQEQKGRESCKVFAWNDLWIKFQMVDFAELLAGLGRKVKPMGWAFQLLII